MIDDVRKMQQKDSMPIYDDSMTNRKTKEEEREIN